MNDAAIGVLVSAMDGKALLKLDLSENRVGTLAMKRLSAFLVGGPVLEVRDSSATEFKPPCSRVCTSLAARGVRKFAHFLSATCGDVYLSECEILGRALSAKPVMISFHPKLPPAFIGESDMTIETRTIETTGRSCVASVVVDFANHVPILTAALLSTSLTPTTNNRFENYIPP